LGAFPADASAVPNLIFHLLVASIFALFGLYWFALDMFTTLGASYFRRHLFLTGYLTVLGVAAALVSSYAF
jgi:hypothetical protein